MATCELCGKEADVEGTEFGGPYCIDCLRLMRDSAVKAIRMLRQRGQKGKAEHTTKEQYDAALDALTHPSGG